MEELVKFREDKVFPKAILVLKESHRESEKNCLTCMLLENGSDIQLDRLGESREGLKVICGGRVSRAWEDRETSCTGSAKPDFE